MFRKYIKNNRRAYEKLNNLAQIRAKLMQNVRQL